MAYEGQRQRKIVDFWHPSLPCYFQGWSTDHHHQSKAALLAEMMDAATLYGGASLTSIDRPVDDQRAACRRGAQHNVAGNL